MVGDFNSNTIWDKKHRRGNHSSVVERLEEKGILSCYHVHHKQIQGKEKDPTFYLYKHKDKPYHIDYCFAPTEWVNRVKQLEIGDYNEWCNVSDHSPLFVEFDYN
jgi:endonuclease/exonuclease/phosphatase family metal-dependent hydrolase